MKACVEYKQSLSGRTGTLAGGNTSNSGTERFATQRVAWDTINNLQYTETTPILRTTPATNPLTVVVSGCHKFYTGRTSVKSAASAEVHQWVEISGVCSSAGVAFLVIESREVMNVRQASQYLGISPDTLYRYITEGEIPAFKLGNRWKLRKTILDRWMERKMSQAHVRRR
jgi:excisionase family DNA binding protein